MDHRLAGSAVTTKKLRPTTVRVGAVDEANVTAVIRSGFANDMTGAVRFALALARRWIDETGAKKKTS